MVTIAIEERCSFVKIDVTDTGVGIGKEDIPRIVEKFYRVKSLETCHIVVTGLGLAIIESIIDDHHGSISVERGKGGGSSFGVPSPKTEIPR